MTRTDTVGVSTARTRGRIRKTYGMFIGGSWVEAASRQTIASVDPTTEETLASVPLAGPEDIQRAVDAASQAQREWGALSWQERARLLRELARRLQEHATEFCELDAIDGGIPVTGMKKDVQNGVDFLLYFAGLASELKGWTIEVPGAGINYTQREPYGVVGRIVPFNHPLQFAAAAIAAPLAAGNSVILKPAEQTPISALRLAELTQDLLPAGVVNVVTGDGPMTGAAIVAHPGVPRIGFTGSVAGGRAVLRAAAEHIKSVSLELGGKNPLIVFADVDVAAVARATVDAMNFRRGQGQSCGSPSRVFVHAEIHDAFVEELKTSMDTLLVGDPLLGETDMGPLAFAAHYERVTGYVEAGKQEGARLVTGGRRPAGSERGYFLQPTLFDRVEPSMRIAREEIFGPVVSTLAWTNEEAVLAEANALPLGLTANIWTNDLSAALRFAGRIQAGYVWINGRGQRPFGAPFGGYKESGLGKENDLDELLSYTRVKNVNVSPL
jgi:betaine-aldehyde dehydrogenase